MTMEIQVDPKLLKIIASLKMDITKVIHEALNLWLREKVIICPIANQFCHHNDLPCNDCSIAGESSL